MAGLRLKHIYKVYNGGVRAVNDFNLDIKDKSFVVLCGQRDGSGGDRV